MDKPIKVIHDMSIYTSTSINDFANAIARSIANGLFSLSVAIVIATLIYCIFKFIINKK